MKELLISLHSHLPKYQQIYDSIRNLIETGSLRADAKLPSIRKLAETLGTSRNTTLTAYEQLMAEGYVRSETARGYFVEPFQPVDVLPKPKPAVFKANPPAPKMIIDFRAGAVDSSAFPLKAWRQCANEVLKQELIYTYGDLQGDPLLREQLAAYLLQSRGIPASSEALVIGSSTQTLLWQLSLLLKKDSTAIAVEDPGYDGARSVFDMQGFHIEPIAVSDRGLQIHQLEEAHANLVYITPSHQFPTGSTMPVAERQRLLQWAERSQGYIIEDDYDSEFRYKQKPIPALASLRQNNRVIYVSTFSKAFLPSIRLSYMLLPPEILDRYHSLLKNLEQTASSLHQRTMAYFMERGHWDSHIRKMRLIYKNKMKTLVHALERHFGDSLEIIGAHSGLYVCIRTKFCCDENSLIEQAAVAGVRVYPASTFFVKPVQNTAMLQLGFGGLSMDEIETGIALLKTAWITMHA